MVSHGQIHFSNNSNFKIYSRFLIKFGIITICNLNLLITPNLIYFLIISIFSSYLSKFFLKYLLVIIIKESDFCDIRPIQLIKNDSNSSGSNRSNFDCIRSQLYNINSETFLSEYFTTTSKASFSLKNLPPHQILILSKY